MAGAGAKKFPAFSKLSSDDVNNYLADQVIMRFATTTARDAAFGGVGEPTLAEGMTAYIDADNSIYTYDGSNWVKIASTAVPAGNNPVGLERVTSCTVTSVGGTSATASNGVITIGTGNTTVTINNAFSADYENYKIIISGAVSSIGTDASCQLTGITGGYQTAGYFMTPGTATLNAYSPPGFAVQWLVGSINATRYTSSFDVVSPFLTQQKFMLNMAGISTTGYYNFSGLCTSTSSATGFSYIANSGNFTAGTIRVYGYRN
jgi:hypothetical protein